MTPRRLGIPSRRDEGRGSPAGVAARGRGSPVWAALLLAAAGCGGTAAGAPGGAPGGRVRTVAIRAELSRFAPDVVEVARGTAVRFVVTNADPIDHEFIVGDAAVHARHESGTEPSHGTVPGEVSVPAEARAATRVRFDVPGSYLFACHLPGHLGYGMRGVVRVR
jgi:uncharacterized cupredoxin-like copper-binding protein